MQGTAHPVLWLRQAKLIDSLQINAREWYWEMKEWACAADYGCHDSPTWLLPGETTPQAQTTKQNLLEWSRSPIETNHIERVGSHVVPTKSWEIIRNIFRDLMAWQHLFISSTMVFLLVQCYKNFGTCQNFLTLAIGGKSTDFTILWCIHTWCWVSVKWKSRWHPRWHPILSEC